MAQKKKYRRDLAAAAKILKFQDHIFLIDAYVSFQVVTTWIAITV